MALIDGMSGGQELDELKIILRALVESYGNRVAIRCLAHYYYKSENKDLSRHANWLGFDNVLELIQEMNDTFGLEINDKHKHFNDYLVYTLSDPNTQHIVNLVANQRQDENEDKEVVQTFPKIFNSRPIVRQRVTENMKPFSLIPKESDDQIEDIELPMGASFRHLMTTTSWRPRVNTQHKQKQRKAVCPLPDSTVVSNEETNRIIELLLKYKTINLCNFAVMYRSHYNTAIEFKRFGSQSVEQFLQRMPQIVYLQPISNGFKVSLTEGALQSYQCSQHKHIKPNDNIEGIIKHKSNEVIDKSDKSVAKQLNNGLIESREFVGQKETKRFEQILDKNPNGISPKDFIKQYEYIFNEPIIPSKLGFCSAIEMFASMSQLFYLQTSLNGSVNCENCLLMRSTPELRSQTVSTLPKRRALDKKLRERAVDVITRANSSIDTYFFVEEFPYAYELMYNEVIDPNYYGFKTFKDLMLSLSKVCDIDVKERVKNKPYLVYRKKI